MPATIELLQEGRYRINQESANNGNSTVYEAYDTVRDTNVVVKEIPLRINKGTTLSQQEQMKLAFASQAKILTEIHHDSLLHVQDYFSEIGRQYLVLESVEGDDLRVLLERNNSAFPVSDVLNWADQMLDALNYLHNFKPPIIHRGIRPEHIKLTSGGLIKLLAFGLADISDTDTNVNTNDSAEAADISYASLEQIWEGLDAASQKVITNSYDEKSERILKEPADARSDIYALGATLYHLLTAVKPIDALERSIDVMEGNPDPLRNPDQVDSEIPVEISEVLIKALEIKRENRFESATIMRQVLRTALIRVKEREAEEVREQREAAENLKLAEQSRQAPPVQSVKATDPEELKRLEMEAEQRKQTEQMIEQLRQVEEQRLQDEELAVEAERLEKEAAEAVPVEPVGDSDDVLLETLFPTAPNSADTAVGDVKDEAPVMLAKPAQSSGKAAKHKKPIAETANEVAKPEKYQSSVRHEPATTYEPDVEPETSGGFPLGMPAIALGVAALVIVIVAAWVLMPGNSGTPERSADPVISVPSSQADVPANTSTEQVTIDPSTSSSTDVSVKPDPVAQKVKKPTPTPKPAKAPETKKPVTADQLINDN